MYIEEYCTMESQRNVNQRQIRKTRQETVRQPTSRPRARSVSLTSLRRHRSTSCDLNSKKRSDANSKHQMASFKSSPLTPVSLLCYAVLCNDEILLKKLLKSYYYDINKLSDDGMSPLHLAALEGNVQIMELLIANGARVNNIDGKSQTVLQYAVWAGQFDAAQLLIQHGCDSSLVKDGFGF